MLEKLVLSGYGGQGILSAGLIIADSGVIEKKQVTYFPSYGAEMRGGTANCQVIFSDTEVASPIIKTADSLIAMNHPSLDKFLPSVKADGAVFINSSVVKEEVDLKGRKGFRIPADQLALENLGSTKAANVIILGAYIKIAKVVSMESLKKALEQKFHEKGDKVIQMNFKALELGYQAV